MCDGYNGLLCEVEGCVSVYTRCIWADLLTVIVRNILDCHACVGLLLRIHSLYATLRRVICRFSRDYC